MATHLSFRIRHPSFDFSSFVDHLGLPASRIWKAGDYRKAPSTRASAYHQNSYCAFNLPDTDDISKAIENFLMPLKHNKTMASFFHEKSFEKSIYCTLESTGEIVTVDALKLLVELNIELQINGC